MKIIWTGPDGYNPLIGKVWHGREMKTEELRLSEMVVEILKKSNLIEIKKEKKTMTASEEK